MAKKHTAYVKQANAYIKDVLDGSIPACKWVKAACERQKADLDRYKSGGAYRFDEDQAAHICEFIELLPHIKGPLSGQPLKLEPWQCFVLTTAFGWVHRSGPRKGKRRFKNVYIEVPRGNGKSALSSGVALYCMAADGEGGAEVYSAATTRDQARIVFDVARLMLRRSPGLVQAMELDVRAHNINQPQSASKFEPLSAEGNSLDGLNIHLAVVDELHAHKTRTVYDALETGTGKRPQSMMWLITTAGSNRAGICYEIRTYLTKLLDGVFDDDGMFGCIWTMDDADDWTAEETWRKANPNWGVSVEADVVGRLAKKAMQMPAATNNFLTKHLNVWVNADTAWMDMRAWERAGDPALHVEDFTGEECVVGLDLASKTDIAARIMLFRRYDGEEPHYYAFGKYYLPEAAAHDGRNSQYGGWEIEGRLITTPGDVTDISRIEQDMRDDASLWQMREIAYDPFQATHLSNRLSADGFEMVEVRPTVLNFSEPMKELEALVLQGRFHHDGDPVLTWMVSNVVCHLDAKDNIYPRKERPENKIDGVVALLMGLARYINEENTVSVYEGRGVLAL